MKRVFITGIAGFIGFHLGLALKKRGDFVIGIDNFNSYYDPELKRERASLLKKEGIDVLSLDLLEREKIRLLVLSHQITHIAHLAAQAGVRHSLESPEDYISSNLDGFFSILEVCRYFPHIKLTYASSSSVYGLSQKVPFSIDDNTDRPTNLYGATKKANELMAHSYHHLFGCSVTALRYFTVYGPWGRPDMAYFRFTEKIANKEPIQVFNSGNMKRDFTYIDDIVDGTLRALDLGAPCEIFNLGSHAPIPLLTLIETIEKALGVEAIRHYLPIQPGEMLETYADIEKSQKLLGFQPKVSLEEGISHFVDWFLSSSFNARGSISMRSSAISP